MLLSLWCLRLVIISFHFATGEGMLISVEFELKGRLQKALLQEKQNCKANVDGKWVARDLLHGLSSVLGLVNSLHVACCMVCTWLNA